MKDCTRCGEAFEPIGKYCKICENCKIKSLEDGNNLRRKLKHKAIPYYLRDVITKE